MDTGLLYRAVALNLLQMDGDPESEFSAARACDIAQIDFADPQLKSEAVGGIASRISAYPMVREHLLERQRMFAAQAGGAVLDGRDIGTVIAPDAEAKLFITATPRCAPGAAARAASRSASTSIMTMCSRTSTRATSATPSRAAAPLVPAADAMIIDTSALGVEEAVAAALAAVRSAHRRPKPLGCAAQCAGAAERRSVGTGIIARNSSLKTPSTRMLQASSPVASAP
jgi:cytidylate kinase